MFKRMTVVIFSLSLSVCRYLRKKSVVLRVTTQSGEQWASVSTWNNLVKETNFFPLLSIASEGTKATASHWSFQDDSWTFLRWTGLMGLERHWALLYCSCGQNIHHGGYGEKRPRCLAWKDDQQQQQQWNVLLGRQTSGACLLSTSSRIKAYPTLSYVTLSRNNIQIRLSFCTSADLSIDCFAYRYLSSGALTSSSEQLETPELELSLGFDSRENGFNLRLLVEQCPSFDETIRSLSLAVRFDQRALRTHWICVNRVRLVVIASTCQPWAKQK